MARELNRLANLCANGQCELLEVCQRKQIPPRIAGLSHFCRDSREERDGAEQRGGNQQHLTNTAPREQQDARDGADERRARQHVDETQIVGFDRYRAPNQGDQQREPGHRHESGITKHVRVSSPQQRSRRSEECAGHRERQCRVACRRRKRRGEHGVNRRPRVRHARRISGASGQRPYGQRVAAAMPNGIDEDRQPQDDADHHRGRERPAPPGRSPGAIDDNTCQGRDAERDGNRQRSQVNLGKR
ncbi:MAG: hypothetical protein GEU99_02805 [Luteitalea sp.]|nr:hypothetical protein [Luteitalea sp.]